MKVSIIKGGGTSNTGMIKTMNCLRRIIKGCVCIIFAVTRI